MAESLFTDAVAAAAGTKRPPPPSSAYSSDPSPPPLPPPLPPPVPQGWTRCHAYVEKKHRFCRQQCQGKQWNQAQAYGPRYCGNHQHLFFCNTIENSTQQSQPDNCNNNENKNQKKRIPCPIDPTHHIPADRLEKHILICPMIKQQQAMEKLYYYRDNLNTGGHGCMYDDESPPTQIANVTAIDTTIAGVERGGGIEWAERVALCVLMVHEQVFSKNHHDHHPQNPDSSEPTSTSNNDDDPIRLYCMSHEEIVKALPLQDLSSSCSSSKVAQHDEKSNLARAIQAYNIKSGGPKHVHQQASLLGHLRQLGAIPSSATTTTTNSSHAQERKRKRINILELGAGRGMMGLVAAGVAAATHAAAGNDVTTPSTTTTTTTTRLILVERSGCRSKADRILRNHKNHAGPFNTSSSTNNNKEDNTVTACTTKDASSDMMTTVQDTTTSSLTPPTTTPSAAAATSFVPLPPPVKDYMNLQDLEWTRMTCDLAHVDMKEVLKHSGSGGGDNDTSSIIQQEQHQQPKQDEQEQEEEIHVVAKHLCGVGTDLALKSLQPIRHSISTCLFATCCHGICFWKDYVGRDYLKSVMIGSSNNNNKSNNTTKLYLSQFGEAEFQLLCQWSAGTVATNWTDSNSSGSGGGKKSRRPDQDIEGRDRQEEGKDNGDDDDDDNQHKTAGSSSNITNNKDVIGVSAVVEALDLICGVQGLGRACQRLIDYGRLEYMRHVLFGNDLSSSTATMAATANTPCQPSNEDQGNVQLVYYVPPDITPQNAALMGRRR